VWVTDLRHADPEHGQPVTHMVMPEGWCSPLVVNGRVYVGFGEGEPGEAGPQVASFGFVYCLDASSGRVIWLFCTNRFDQDADNRPNVIPASAAAGPLPPGFTTAPDPPAKGASVWSSCAYDRDLGRIYVGTGNSNPDDLLPAQAQYGSGVLALDATTGEFQGFFQPAATDNYRPDDNDVDVPSSPTLFTHGGVRKVGIGTKSGAFFVLDAHTMAPLARRQLLPYDEHGAPFSAVDPHEGPGENYFGVFGTAAVHGGLGHLYVGVGGYGGGIDNATTPFMRALHCDTLADAWPTVGTNPPKYAAAAPPMYATTGEAGLSSPAVVNDVVVVTTTKPGLYAFDAATGICLWAASDLGVADYCLGVAIYGDAIVAGIGGDLAAGHIYVYTV
jgi:outer membrane protein assembly factor BamB